MLEHFIFSRLSHTKSICQSVLDRKYVNKLTIEVMKDVVEKMSLK